MYIYFCSKINIYFENDYNYLVENWEVKYYMNVVWQKKRWSNNLSLVVDGKGRCSIKQKNVLIKKPKSGAGGKARVWLHSGENWISLHLSKSIEERPRKGWALTSRQKDNGSDEKYICPMSGKNLLTASVKALHQTTFLNRIAFISSRWIYYTANSTTHIK